jgi:hypothetical protein
MLGPTAFYLIVDASDKLTGTVSTISTPITVTKTTVVPSYCPLFTTEVIQTEVGQPGYPAPVQIVELYATPGVLYYDIIMSVLPLPGQSNYDFFVSVYYNVVVP